MKSSAKHIFTAAILLLTFSSATAQVDKRDQSKLRSANLAADSAEKKIAEANEEWQKRIDDGQPIQGGIFDIYERRVADAERQIERAEDYLSKMTSGATEQQQVRERLSKIKSDIAAFKKRMDDEKNKASGESTILEEGLAKDKPTLEAVSTKLQDFSDSVTSGWVENDVIDNYAQAVTDAKALIAKYGNLRAESPEAKTMVSEVKLLNNTLESSQRSLDEAMTQIPLQINESVKLCNDFANSAIQNGSFGQFTEYVEPRMGYIRTWIRTYAIISKGHPQADPNLIAKTEAELKKLSDTMTAQEAKIIAQNKLPANAYTGSDRTKLVEIAANSIKQSDPNAKILSVRIEDANWRHIVKWVWDSSNSSWYKRDYSVVEAVVIVASPDGKQGWMRPCAFTKNHLNNNTVTVMFSQSKGKPNTPFWVLPIEKVK